MPAMHTQCNIAWAYQQLPLDHVDWPLVCLKVGQQFFTDISLPFRLGWAVASCQDVTSLITNSLVHQGLRLLKCLDYLGVASSKLQAKSHFTQLQTTLTHLGMEEAIHKLSPQAQHMIWL